jgi:hypothetical protein
LLIGVPAAFRKQAVDIGQRAVATNEEPQPFGVRLTRPAPVPRLTARVAWVEPDAPQRLPAAMRASLNIAAFLVLLAETDAAIRTGMVFHPFS